MEDQVQTKKQGSQMALCPVCGSAQQQRILEIGQVPVLANVLWDSRDEARSAPRGDIQLVFCESCGHVFNQAFSPDNMDYDAAYENSLHFSPRFQQYADWLAHRLVQEYDLRGKTIIEIGSGKGDFLRLLCEFGGNVGTGFDPSSDPSTGERHGSISLVRDTYDERYSHYHADLICSRHTLEHIYQPAQFIQTLRQTIGDRKRTVVFFEVPNMAYVLRETAVWDVIYEHYSYYTANSLARLFTANGFNVLNVASAFEGQFLTLEAIPREVNRPAPNAPYAMSMDWLAGQVASFGSRSKGKIIRWREQLNEYCQGDKRTVLWGAGSKGISFLNLLGVKDEIEYIVDINPRKRNKYITGTGQQVIPPEFLKEFRPDTVIFMNPIYQQEIENTVRGMGLDAEVLAAV